MNYLPAVGRVGEHIVASRVVGDVELPSPPDLIVPIVVALVPSRSEPIFLAIGRKARSRSAIIVGERICFLLPPPAFMVLNQCHR